MTGNLETNLLSNGVPACSSTLTDQLVRLDSFRSLSLMSLNRTEFFYCGTNIVVLIFSRFLPCDLKIALRSSLDIRLSL